MLLFYFHNLGFSDPILNLLALLILLGGWLSSMFLIPYGLYSLIRYWGYLDRKLQLAFALSPVIAIGVISVFPWHLAWLSFPFGFFAGIPVIVIVTINLGPENLTAEYAMAYVGFLANICGIVGISRKISKRFGYR